MASKAQNKGENRRWVREIEGVSRTDPADWVMDEVARGIRV